MTKFCGKCGAALVSDNGVEEMKMQKGFLTVLLALCLVINLLPASALAASAGADAFSDSDISEVIASGTCGENLSWVLDCDGTLTISGTGEMRKYSSDSYAPWYADREKIKYVIIQSGVTSIGKYAFYDCNGLTRVEIPDDVTEIGAHAFCGCKSLTGVEIPPSVVIIEWGTFKGCWDLTEVKIPSSVTIIGNEAFYGCSGLTRVEMPASVISIGYYAFYGCSGLTRVEIPASMIWIGYDAFLQCYSLKDVYYSGTEEEWQAVQTDVTNSILTSALIHFNSTDPEGGDIVVNPEKISVFALTESVTGSSDSDITIRGALALSDDTESSLEILTSEVDSIQWISSDQDIVRNDEISCIGINSYDNRKAELLITFTPHKKGMVTITGTASNGLTADCELAISDNSAQADTFSMTKDVNKKLKYPIAKHNRIGAF